MTGRLRGRRRGAATAALVLLLAACATAQPQAEPAAPARTASVSAQPIDRELALLTFDSAWSRVHHSYYDSTFRGLDWRAIGAEFRPRAEAARTTGELRSVLNGMLARLGESHFGIIPRESLDGIDGANGERVRVDADVGIELRWVEGELTVVRVQEDGPAQGAGVDAGWIIDAIDDLESTVLKSVLDAADSDATRRGLLVGTLSAATRRLAGSNGSTVVVRFRDGSDDIVTRTLTRQPVRGEPVQFGNLPTFFSYLEHRRSELAGDGCAAIVHFNVWMPLIMPELDRAIDAHADCRGVVFDLRGNPGGVGGLVMAAAGSFFDRNEPLGVLRTRSGEVRFVAMPRRITHDGKPRSTFTGPVAVIVDEQSMSTSEIFAAGMQATGRARVFGTPTPGYALPALMLRLPNDDVLYHAIANLTDPTGRRIEGAGVIPDEARPLTRPDLLAGRDRALEAALAWIAAQPRAATDGH